MDLKKKTPLKLSFKGIDAEIITKTIKIGKICMRIGKICMRIKKIGAPGPPNREEQTLNSREGQSLRC